MAKRHKAKAEDEAPGLTARRFAADALLAILHKRRSLEEVFETGETGETFRSLEERDRALARMIVATSLRRAGSLQMIIEQYLQAGWPEDVRVHAILLAGAAQIALLDVPDHAAVDLSVRLAGEVRNKRYAGLVNAVLRRVALDGRAKLDALDPAFDTPPWLRERWGETYGEENLRLIAEAHRVEPALDLTPKSDAEALAKKLEGILLPSGSVRLAAKGAITQLPGYAEGEWWVQDAAATIPAKLLGDVRGLRVADLCAAPGGKTAQLANAGANVIAVDRSAPRLKRLEQNLARLNLTAEVICADAAAFDTEPFDAILLDAPCSATGTIRRHPDILWQKQPEDLAALTRLQARLLDHAANLLKPGGLLVYSTCSLEPDEGELQIEALLARRTDLTRVPIEGAESPDPRSITARGDLRTLPFHMPNPEPRLAGCDGFFASRLRKIA